MICPLGAIAPRTSLPLMMNRRTLLVCATASAALAALGITPTVLAAGRIKLGDARPFSFDALIERARAVAGGT